MSIPNHIIDPSLFLIGDLNKTSKQSSLSTIFSVGNTMIGSGLISLPWAFANSGILLAIIVTLVVFILSFYTCYLVIITSENQKDYADSVYKYYGRNGFRFATIGSMMLILSGGVAYYEIMSQSMYPGMNALLKWILGVENEFTLSIVLDKFSLQYTGLILTVFAFPVISMKDLSFFMKINAYGILFVLMVVVFIISFGVIGMTTTTYVFDEENILSENTRYIPLFRKNFASLAGILSLGFYLHNIAVPIINTNENPK